MKLNKGNKRGISLIVLVITIIVMIILATAIILSLNSSGIIGKANKAKLDTDESNMLEAANVAYAEYQLEKQMGELKDSTQTAEAYVKDKLKNRFTTDSLSHLSILNDGTIQAVPIIPEGFVMSPYAGENKVIDGLVIYKTDAETIKSYTQVEAQELFDQFVWVPVLDMADFERTNWVLNEPTKLYYLYTEPFKDGYIAEASEYNEMKSSVEKHRGFYIGRYEAGDGKATVAREGAGTSEVVIRKGVFVYNYVSWGKSMSNVSDNVSSSKGRGAVYLSSNLYPTTDNYITHLIYGVQWDATMRWLSDKYSVTDSRNWGNHSDSQGEAATNSGRENMNFTTGRNEAWKAKNIYDLAGNVQEWTMEAYRYNDNSKFLRVSRGGDYDRGGYSTANIGNTPVSNRTQGYTTNSLRYGGFRPVLYLK